MLQVIVGTTEITVHLLQLQKQLLRNVIVADFLFHSQVHYALHLVPVLTRSRHKMAK
jgi:hypothetical protein